MTPLASVLVPYRSDGGYRDAAWRFIEPAWQRLGVELIVESPGPGSSPAEFNHPAAINAARRRASSDVLIVADADTGWDSGWVEEACALVRAGASWALPTEYWQLSKAQTEALRNGTRPVMPEALWVGVGNAYSGVVVIEAEAFDHVGGYDERWAWWGSDDGAFAVTMTTLVEAPERIPGRALHHWHPRPEEMHARQGDQHTLMRRYHAAAGDVDALAAVRFEHWADGQTLG